MGRLRLELLQKRNLAGDVRPGLGRSVSEGHFESCMCNFSFALHNSYKVARGHNPFHFSVCTSYMKVNLLFLVVDMSDVSEVYCT